MNKVKLLMDGTYISELWINDKLIDKVTNVQVFEAHCVIEIITYECNVSYSSDSSTLSINECLMAGAKLVKSDYSMDDVPRLTFKIELSEFSQTE